MRCVVSQIKKKGLIGFFSVSYNIDCPFGEQVGGVTFWVDFLIVETHIVIIMTQMSVVIVHHIAKEPSKIIEPAGAGMILLF